MVFFDWNSIRTRLFVLTALALCPAVFVIALSNYQIVQSRRAEVNNLAQRNAGLVAAELQTMHQGIKSFFFAILNTRMVKNRDDQECTRYLNSLDRGQTNIADMAIFDADQNSLCGTATSAMTTAIGDATYRQEILKGEDAVIGTYQIETSGQKVLPLAMAGKDASGGTVIIVGVLDIGILNQRFKANQLAGGQNSSLTVADKDGTIIIRDPFPDRFIGTAIPANYMALVDAKTSGVADVMSQDGTERILGYEPLSMPPVGLYVSVGLSRESSFAVIERQIYSGIAIALIGSVLAFFLTWQVGRNLFIRPIEHVGRTVEAWINHGDDVRIRRRIGATEIVSLAQRLDTMKDQLEQQKYMNAILIQELNHRIKNTIATTQALARMSFRHFKNDRAPAAFDRRLSALATAHETLLRNQWTHADLRQTVEKTIFNLFGAVPPAFVIDGPEINVGRRHVLAVTMIVHELTTNAMKYGALSQEEGVVRVTWTAASVGDGTQIFFKWLERKGPPVHMPQTTGFGTTLIQQAFASDFEAIKYEYAADGVTCELSWIIARDELSDARHDHAFLHSVTAAS